MVGEMSIDATSCQESSQFAGLCPPPPPGPSLPLDPLHAQVNPGAVDPAVVWGPESRQATVNRPEKGVSGLEGAPSG